MKGLKYQFKLLNGYFVRIHYKIDIYNYFTVLELDWQNTDCNLFFCSISKG